MTDYRVYLLGLDGRIRRGFDVSADTDEDAVRQAADLTEGAARVEVWRGTTRIETIEGKRTVGL